MERSDLIFLPVLQLQVPLLAALVSLLFSCSHKKISSRANPDITSFKESVVASSPKINLITDEASIDIITNAGTHHEQVKALTFVKESLHTQLAQHFEKRNDQKIIFLPNKEILES